MADAVTLKAAAIYALVWTLSAIVGAVIAGFGLLQWVVPAYFRYAEGTPAAVALQSALPGVLLLLLGLLVWKLVSTLALYRTLPSTVAVDTADRLNTEAMKSDILSVLDERLADMKRDTQRTRRIVERESSGQAADEFAFSEDR